MTTFKDLNLDEKIQQGIEDIGYTDCTDVQSQTFEETFQGKDVLVQSQTGTGKTGAFLISIFEQISKDASKKALILAPTRELALQIYENAISLNNHLNHHIVSIVGGVSYTKQLKALEKKPDLLIATPGRVIDLNNNNQVNFKDYSVLVIDEADRLLEMGFYQDLMKIIEKCPKKSERQTMMFSATIHHRIKYLAEREMNTPKTIHIQPETLTVDRIKQSIYHVPKSEKINLLLGILKDKKAAQVIIFTNMKQSTFELSERLNANGYNSSYLIGDLSQSKRNRIIKEMQEGEISILVATDIAARGLHIENLPLVINYDLPNEAETYVHRIGRTGRAGQDGEALSFGCEESVYHLPDIEALIGNEIPVATFNENDLIEDVSKGRRFRLDYKSPRRSGDKKGPHGKRDCKRHTDRDGKKPYSKRRDDDRDPKKRYDKKKRFEDKESDGRSKQSDRETTSPHKKRYNKKRPYDKERDQNRPYNRKKRPYKKGKASTKKPTGLWGKIKGLFSNKKDN